MKTLWVKRANSSSYFPANFEILEKNALESVPGVRYLAPTEMPQVEQKICLITNTHTKLSDWDQWRDQIELILHPNSGMDNFTSDLKNWAHTPIVLGNPIRAQAVAEWILACLFQHFTPIEHHPTWPKTREWTRPLLSEKKILIFGFGHIGKMVNQALVSLGATPHVHDPYQGKTMNLTEKWDVAILCASLNSANHGLLNEEFFKVCSSELLIVNPARYEFINGNALKDFLSRSPNAKCFLDVHPEEPYIDNFWKDFPQIIATPHLAGVWSGLIEKMLQFEVDILADWTQKSQSEFTEKHSDLLLSNRLTDKGWYR